MDDAERTTGTIKAGYWTASVGKVFHSPRHEHGEVAWNEFIHFENDELPVVRLARETFEAEHGSVEKGRNRKKWRELKKQVSAKLDVQTPPGYGRSGLTDEQHKDGKNARQVAKWLSDQAHGEKPFFIACGIQKPHVPFLAPDKYFDLYRPNKIAFTPDRPNLWDSLPKTAMSKRYEAFRFEVGKENESLRREYMQAYHACVSFIDAQLKIVLEHLGELTHRQSRVELSNLSIQAHSRIRFGVHHKFGVLGASPIVEKLRLIATKRRLNGRSLKISAATTGDELHGCHILFISRDVPDETVARLAVAPSTIVVGERADLLNMGASAIFFIDGTSVRFELNRMNLAEKEIRVDAKLLRLSRSRG